LYFLQTQASHAKFVFDAQFHEKKLTAVVSASDGSAPAELLSEAKLNELLRFGAVKHAIDRRPSHHQQVPALPPSGSLRSKTIQGQVCMLWCARSLLSFSLLFLFFYLQIVLSYMFVFSYLTLFRFTGKNQWEMERAGISRDWPGMNWPGNSWEIAGKIWPIFPGYFPSLPLPT